MRKNKNHLLVFALILLVGCAKQKKADLILHNGHIITVDSSFSTAEAIALGGGKILGVGKNEEILEAFVSESKEDLGGNFVYPGFIDAHAHFLGYGMNKRSADLRGSKSFEEVIDRLKAHAQKYPNGWLEGRGWDQNLWLDKRFPDNFLLNQAFPNRPVAIRRIDGHAMIVNDIVLNEAGIKGYQYVKGGEILLKYGKPSGTLIDAAMQFVWDIMPTPDSKTMAKALLDAQEDCFKVGLTSIHDAGLDLSAVEVIDSLITSGDLKMLMYIMLSLNKENLDYYLSRGPIEAGRHAVRAFKAYADGALGSRGALLKKPYSDRRGHVGSLIPDVDSFRRVAKTLYEKGFQLNTHCIGDSANHVILKQYAEILKGKNDRRWRIEHAQVVSDIDLPYFEEFNIIPSIQPTHATSDMYWAEERLGQERIITAYRYADLLSVGGLLAMGSDFPVEHINPLYGFVAAVTRQDHEGWPEVGFIASQSLNREDALRGMTIWAAYAGFMEDTKGSIEAGKYADLTILPINLLIADPQEIISTEVVATYIGGEKVYSNAP